MPTALRDGGGNLGGAGGGSPTLGEAVPVPKVRCGECPAGRECCLSTGTCYDPQATPEACGLPAAAGGSGGTGAGGVAGSAGAMPASGAASGGSNSAAETRTPCSSNAHCQPNEFCSVGNRVDLVCVGSGYCSKREDCGGQCQAGPSCEREVCGCDGKTYANAVAACMAGVRMAANAACGAPPRPSSPPGDVGCQNDASCPSGFVCCAVTGRCVDRSCPNCCGAAPPGTRAPCGKDTHCRLGEYCAGTGCGGPGGCKPRGSQANCGGQLDPVCGCDGISYQNACWADAAAVRVATKGACR